MAFTHDTDMALNTAVALVNSGDDLSTPEDLAAFVVRWQMSGARTGTAAELAAVQAIRPRLREIWYADDGRAVEIVNTLLREADALPQLVRHDGWDWHLHATPSDAALADRLAVEAAMAMVDVIRMGDLDRLQVCAADDCDDVLVDLSRNRSRRFCDGGCGNRANVAAYRARRATT
ncbi:CGNR zinc finger domain-containing protein [soil metagenome]